MGETFLININCAKVLGDGDEAQYTMFIDSSKMSIVYELVEWIRWMFSLETCFYITHNNSVIHELEDVQLLSRLQNFDLKPCGRTNCVHKKLYRMLLKNLNLFVSWNGVEVHKYFLHKLNQMDQKLIEESNKASPKMTSRPPSKDLQHFLDYKDKSFDNTKNINPESLSENNLGAKEDMPLVKKTTLISKVEANWGANNESATQKKYFINKEIKSKGNLSSSEDNFSSLYDINAGGENSTLESLKRVNNTSPIKNELRGVQEARKSCAKSQTKKCVKPFSIGEILSNMREELEKQKTEKRKTPPLQSPLLMKEEDNDEKMTVTEDSFPSEKKNSGGKKRQRTRRRKRSKKEKVDDLISQFLDKSPTDCSLAVPLKSNGSLQPNHIRFDSDVEDSLMETDCIEDNSKAENQLKCDSVNKELNGFSESEPKELVPMITDIPSRVNGSDNKVPGIVASQFAGEEKLTDLDSQTCENANHLYKADGEFESNTFNPDLNKLLSLKEKFKNAVIFERFY